MHLFSRPDANHAAFVGTLLLCVAVVGCSSDADNPARETPGAPSAEAAPTGSIQHSGSHAKSLPDKDLAALLALAGRELAEEDRRSLRSSLEDERVEIRAAAAAILYCDAPSEHQDLLYASFCVHDYEKRGRGEYTMKQRADVAQRVSEIEQEHGALGQEALLLLVFLDFRDKNVWFMVADKRISAARFFRSAFLGRVFAKSDLDAVDVANWIDLRAHKELRAVL
jgi:hypothetical protein